jgi:hypothetical protein
MMQATLPRRREIHRPAAVIVPAQRGVPGNYNFRLQIWTEGLALADAIFIRHVEGFSMDEAPFPSVRCAHVNVDDLPPNCILTYADSSSTLLLIDTQRPPRPKLPNAPILVSLGSPMIQVTNFRKMSLSLQCSVSRLGSQMAFFRHSLYRAPLCCFIRMDASCDPAFWRRVCDQTTKSLVLYWTDAEPNDASSLQTVVDAMKSLVNVVGQLTLHSPPRDLLVELPAALEGSLQRTARDDQRPTEFSVMIPENRAEELSFEEVKALARSVNGVICMHSLQGDYVNGSVKLDFTGPPGELTVGMAGMSTLYLGNHLLGEAGADLGITKLRLEMSATSLGNNNPALFAKHGRILELAIETPGDERDFEQDLGKLSRAAIAYDAFLRAEDQEMVIYPNPNRDPPIQAHPEMDEESYRFLASLVRYTAYLPIPFGYDVNFVERQDDHEETAQLAFKSIENTTFVPRRGYRVPVKVMAPVPLIKSYVPRNWPARSWVKQARRPAAQV